MKTYESLYSTGIFDLIDRRNQEFKLFKRIVWAQVSPEIWQKICDEYNVQLNKCKCEESYNCCDCGDNACGCRGCWSCNACDKCKSLKYS